MKIEVNAFWDDETSVWVAEGDTIPGLVAEAESLDALVRIFKNLVPELVELNGMTVKGSAEELPILLKLTCKFTATKET